MTPRSRTVDDGENKEEEVESESSAHCRSLEERSNQMSSDLPGLSFKRIDRLQSMMSSMQARSLIVASATSFSRRCTMYIELGVVSIEVNFYAMTRGDV